MHIAALNPKDVSALLQQDFIKGPGVSVKKLIQDATEKYSQNIEITRFVRWDSDGEPESGDPPPKLPAVTMKAVK